MNLNELFRNPKLALSEGGNLSSQTPGWQGVPGDHQAQELDLHVHNRAYVQDVVSQTLHAINDVFAQQHKEPLWHESSVKTQKFLSGSTFQFMDKNISDEEFVRVKPKVGDIDTQASDKHEETIKNFLGANVGKQMGNAVLLGFSPGNSQYTSLWEIKLKDLPVKIQIDFEYGAHEETGLPTDWQSYSHSSAWDDISQNIKGVFHKYLDRALPYAQARTKYVARVLKRSTKISPAPVTDSDYSFAVSGPGGGGVSQKYIPYNDPATGQPMVKDGIPVMQLLEPSARQYIQNLGQQFEIFFGRKPTGNDQQLKNSFVGTVQLIAKYLDDQKKEEIAQRFFSICFEPGSQMITKDDPARDRDIKFAAIDWMLENMKLANAAGLRKQAIEMATAYAAAFQNKAAAKTAPLKEEAQVKAQFRKGMPHLHDLKPADLLDLLDEIHDGNGNFKLQNIPLNVKVDGFGGRFGKNSDGKPFMGTSRTEPRYEPGFVAYHQKKGTTDPEVLGRAELFDQLFEEMMNAVKLVDNKLGPGFLVNKQVTCEVLYLPFATETPEGKLKFVGIHYDKLPSGVKLALVPFRITDATTGDDLPNSNKIVQELTSVGQSGSVMFIDNSLTQNEALDVTALVPPVENIDELKAMLASNKLEARRQVKAALEPVAAALEKAIINDPNIIGKDMLGKDYEGIVINSRLGPIKVTSQEQRDVITAKNAAVAAGKEKTKELSQVDKTPRTAVVATGNFAGHRGHEQLIDLTIAKAKELGGTPFVFVGKKVGPDDPIDLATKMETLHKLYPGVDIRLVENQTDKATGVVTQGSDLKKVEVELVKQPPYYNNILIAVGTDQGPSMRARTEKLTRRFSAYEPLAHVKVSAYVTDREADKGGTGVSTTELRDALKNLPEEEAFKVWSRAYNVKKLGIDWIKHLMDIARGNMGIQQPVQQKPVQQPVQQQPAPAPIAEQRVLNALVEGTSIDSTLRSIINDIGEPITNVYETMKFQAKKYMENHGELGRGFRMVAAGVGGRWVQNMYIGRLHNELHDLCKYNTRRTVDLRDFLRGEEADGELEMKRSFGNISNNLPPILAKLGEQINAPQLTRNARRWMQNKAEYERYLMDLEALGDEQDEPAIKPPKSTAVGQQNAQVDQIVNDVLSKIPKNIAGEIRNAIARAPNKLAALKQELDRHHVKMAEDTNAMAHMAKDLTGKGAPIAKAAAQRDKKREQQSAQSHGRSEGPKWGVAEGSSYNIDQDDHDEFTPAEIVRIKNSHFPDTLRDNLRAAKKEARRAKHFSSNSDGGDSNLGSPVGSASDNTYEGVAEGLEQPIKKSDWFDPTDMRSPEKQKAAYLNHLAAKKKNKNIGKEQGVAEARMSAAQRLWNAEQKQRAKSDASLARTPSSIPKPEPKKDEKTNEEGGVGVIATKKQAKDPRYSMSLTKDVRPGQVEKNLKAFSLAELRAVEPDPAGYQKDLLTSPKNALVVDTPGDLDWYKLGQHYPSLGSDDPHEYGQSDSDMVIVPYDKKELVGLKQKLDRLKMRYKDIGGGHEQPEIHDKVEEKMLPKSAFAGSDKNKLGPAGQWKNTGPSKNRPARAGDLVGGDSVQHDDTPIEEKIKGVDGKACWKGKRYAGTENGKDVCIPVSEDVENIMDALINKIIVNEAISNNRK